MFGQDLSAWTAPEQVSVRYIRFAAAGQRAGPAKGAGAAQAARGPADVHGAASVRAGCDGTLWAIALLRQLPAASGAQGPITAGSTSVARSVKRERGAAVQAFLRPGLLRRALLAFLKPGLQTCRPKSADGTGAVRVISVWPVCAGPVGACGTGTVSRGCGTRPQQRDDLSRHPPRDIVLTGEGG